MLTFQFEGKSMRLPAELVEISVNGQLFRTIHVTDWTSVVIPDIPSQAGDNRVHFRTFDNGDAKYGIQLRNIRIAFAE